MHISPLADRARSLRDESVGCDDRSVTLMGPEALSEGGIDAGSTHQYPDGPVTAMRRRAAELGWSVSQWCYRETLAPHSDNPASRAGAASGDVRPKPRVGVLRRGLALGLVALSTLVVAAQSPSLVLSETSLDVPEAGSASYTVKLATALVRGNKCSSRPWPS